MAQIDDAEPVAFGIGQDDEVGIVRVEIPVDSLGTERDETFDLAACSASESTCRSRWILGRASGGISLCWSASLAPDPEPASRTVDQPPNPSVRRS